MKKLLIILAAAALCAAFTPKPKPTVVKMSPEQWEKVKWAVDNSGTYGFYNENVVLTVTNSVPNEAHYRSPGTLSGKRSRHPRGYQNQTTH